MEQRTHCRLIQSMDTIKDQSDTTNSTLTDMSARLERLESSSPDLNPVELRTNPSDGNFVFHAVPTQVTAPLATRPSITSEVSEAIYPLLDDPLELQKVPNYLELIADCLFRGKQGQPRRR